MKRINVIIAVVFMAASIVGCQSPQDKQINAQETLDKANSDLSKSNQDSAIKAQKDSAEIFFSARKDWEKQININQKMIAELKGNASMDKKKGTPDYMNKLVVLQQRNDDLTETIRSYNYNDSTWFQSRRDINNRMSDLISSIKSNKL
jgi:hypothetical protein